MKLPQLYDIFREKWEKYQSVWLISDTHFDDKELYVGTKHVMRANSDDYVKLINSKVGRKDAIIHLGDVGNIEPIAKIRAAHKILVMGNHDSGKSNYTDVFQEIYEGPVMIGEKLILSHEPLGLDWAFNIHGHVHSFSAENEKNCFNICPDATGHFEPIPLKQILEGGYMSKIETVHRDTINRATKRARKRGYKYGKKMDT